MAEREGFEPSLDPASVYKPLIRNSNSMALSISAFPGCSQGYVISMCDACTCGRVGALSLKLMGPPEKSNKRDVAREISLTL